MAELQAEGFSAANYNDVRSAALPGQRRVFLTFDDGFCDVFDNALPVLAKHGFRAIEFLVADLLGKTSLWQQRRADAASPLMDQAQIMDWLGAGHEIGSHTLKHPQLTKIPLPEAREEITASKKKLEDIFGRPINHFCYPYGDWNQAVRDLVAEAGYVTACITEFGVNWSGADPLALKRITARYASRNWKTLWNWLRSAG
jgi:peptidoglycan/xylan/chitin deacetylase (PgdA/CDA1 family)